MELNEQTWSYVKQLGEHMPGGFFIYTAESPEEILYVNQACMELFGCQNLEEFSELTGMTFDGMLYHEDYRTIYDSIVEQISFSDKNMDYVEYRIVRRDGTIRWVNDYGHYCETEAYGGIYFVFISDITEKREMRVQANLVRDAVIEALTNTYNTVWLISNVDTETCMLFHTDDDSIHTEAIRNALSHTKYTDTKNEYVATMVAKEDQKRMQEEISLPYILQQFASRDRFSVTFLRDLPGGPRYYRIDFGKVKMPGGHMGVTMGFLDVDDEIRREHAYHRAMQEAQETEEENRRLIQEVQSAARLAELMASVSSLLTNMPAMSFSKDAETGVYLACNQAFAEYAGKSSPSEVVGLTDYDIFDPETAAHFVEDDRKALGMESAYIFFEDVPDATGTDFRNLQTTKLKFKDPSGKSCLLGMCVDVTEMTHIKTAEAESRAKQQELEARLALQEQLLEQERQRKEQDSMITAMASDYRSVYHVNLDTDDAVCYRSDPNDPDQTPEGVHFPYHARFTYYANKYVTEEYREGFLRFIEPEYIREALSKEVILTYRYLAHRGGREYYEMIRVAGVRHAEDRDDHTVHAVGVGLTVIDAEMRENLAKNRALVEALASAEEANKAKTAFLSNMSHEIRTPMNAIIGLDCLALRDETLSPITREYLEKINGSAKHLLGLINDILDMSRIESGRLVLRKEEFSFSAMLEQINTLVMTQCSDKGLNFECHINGHIDNYYVGDVMKLKQVLINILSNAIKFTEAPGGVTLTIERTNVYEDHSTLRFSVRDTGIGISEAFLPKIFESFTQEDSSRNNKYSSTGLGMAITKNIVELMNGTISVTSQKGVGSEFVVVITLKNCDTPHADLDDIRAKDMRVLVVDDDPIACEHALVVMEEAGIRADTCLNGCEAIDMMEVSSAKQEPYNLVLLDWKMPEMDGLEVAKEIRKRFSPDTTVIILTSYSWDEIMDEALHIGVDSFLSKPLFAANVIEEFVRIARRNSLNLLREKQRADLKDKHILLAEDIFINAEIVKELIRSRGAEIDHAENGRLAVQLFANSPAHYYDAILMDVRMPEMDGLEATALIRDLERADAKSVPIIAMTANAFDEDVQRSLQVGMNAHLSKPVEPEHLYKTLEELIWEKENC
ncbi:MAG: response regulator [bacterium]|nr:response regulator [bacterium]